MKLLVTELKVLLGSTHPTLKHFFVLLLAKPLALLLGRNRLANPENSPILNFEDKMPVNVIRQLSFLYQKTYVFKL